MNATEISRPEIASVFSGNIRVQGLDIMRALAVFLILGHHAAYRFPPEAADPIAQTLKYAGWIGVDIFFVISGFMITGILIRDTQRSDIPGFFIRRFYRIVPIFAVALVCFALVTLLSGGGVTELKNIWSPALFLNGWTIPFLGYEQVPYTIAWSLSVEETAYILLGLSCVLAIDDLRKTLLLFLITAVTVRMVAVLADAIDLFELYFFVPARLDSIALGGLGALGCYSRLTGWRFTGLLAGATTFALIWLFQYVRLENPVMPTVGYLVFALVCALLITSIGLVRNEANLGSMTAVLGRSLPVRLIAHFGKLSYFVYLFHLFVLEALLLLQGWFLPEGGRLSYWSAVFLACLVVYGMAAISWRYFEYPLIQWSKARKQGSRFSKRTQPAGEG